MIGTYGVPGGATGIDKECMDEWQALQRAKYLRAKRAGGRIPIGASLARSIPPAEWMRRCRARKVGPIGLGDWGAAPGDFGSRRKHGGVAKTESNPEGLTAFQRMRLALLQKELGHDAQLPETKKKAGMGWLLPAGIILLVAVSAFFLLRRKKKGV